MLKIITVLILFSSIAWLSYPYKKWVIFLTIVTNLGTMYALWLTAEASNKANDLSVRKMQKNTLENQFDLMESILNSITTGMNYHTGPELHTGKEAFWRGRINRAFLIHMFTGKLDQQKLFKEYYDEFVSTVHLISISNKLEPADRKLFINKARLELRFIKFCIDIFRYEDIASSNIKPIVAELTIYVEKSIAEVEASLNKVLD